MIKRWMFGFVFLVLLVGSVMSIATLTKFTNNLQSENITFTTPQNITRYFRLYNNSNISSFNMTLTSYRQTYGAHLWNYTFSNAIGASRSYTPIAVNNYIYYSVKDETDQNSYIYALNGTTGNQIWNYSLGITNSTKQLAYFNDAIIFLTYSNYLYKINATTGTHIYNVSFEYGNLLGILFDLNEFETISPTIDDTGIYFGRKGRNITYKYFYAYNLDGTHNWNYSTNRDITTSALIDNESVYFGTDEGQGLFYSLNKSTGIQNWNISLPLNEKLRTSPILNQNIIYLGTYNTGYIIAINKTNGNQLWNTSLTTGAATGTLALTDNNLLVPQTNRFDVFNSTNGSLLWSKTSLGSFGGVLSLNNHFILPEATVQELQFFDSNTGLYLFNYSIPSGITSDTSACFYNGKVYIGSAGNKSYALDFNYGTGNKNWITQGADYNRTGYSDNTVGWYITNLELDIGNDTVIDYTNNSLWDGSKEVSIISKINTTQMKNLISSCSCVGCYLNNGSYTYPSCTFPIVFNSETSGILEVSNMNISYHVPPTITQGGITNYTQTLTRGSNVTFILDVSHDFDFNINQTSVYNIDFINNNTNTNLSAQYTILNVGNESVNSTIIYVNVSPSGATSLNLSFNITITEENGYNYQTFPIYLNIVNFSAAVDFNDTAVWTSNYDTNDVIFRKYIINNTGNYNATDCNVYATGILQNYLSTDKTNFNIESNNYTDLTVTFTDVAAADFNVHYLHLECNGTSTNDIVFSSYNKLNFTVVPAVLGSTSGGDIKKDCSLNIEPASLTFNKINEFQRFLIVNNDDSSYAPNIQIDDTNLISIFGDISTIILPNDREEVIIQSLKEFNETKITLISNDCVDIEIPIYYNETFTLIVPTDLKLSRDIVSSVLFSIPIKLPYTKTQYTFNFYYIYLIILIGIILTIIISFVKNLPLPLKVLLVVIGTIIISLFVGYLIR